MFPTLNTQCGAQELARVTGSGGLCVGLGSHGIALPPILNLGSEELRRRVIPPVLAGDAIAALGITEPSGGSDVANLRTTARYSEARQRNTMVARGLLGAFTHIVVCRLWSCAAKMGITTL